MLTVSYWRCGGILVSWTVGMLVWKLFLPTAREGNVSTGVCDSGHNRPHAYSVTAYPIWQLGHLL